MIRTRGPWPTEASATVRPVMNVPSTRTRGAVIGLGMIGRHHARLLQSSDRVEFAGAVDPGGDRYRAVHDPALVYDTTEALLGASGDGVDFAIVAVPTELHLPVAEALAGAGVAMLIEKPLASSGVAARQILELCARAGVAGAVGHVERFNPALQEMRRRMLGGQIGRLFTVSTVRSGPFPSRIQDVGVVKDLATHDIDLVSWLADSPIATVAAQTQFLTGRDHEDLVLATGALASGAAFNMVVDWVSPAKVRRARVLGERGLLEADSLTGDLFFYENGEMGVVWSAAQQFRGVSEGDVTRYALRREEPLRIEHETFLNLLDGRSDHDAEVVTLEKGVEIVEGAEAVLRSASSGETVRLAPLPDA
jgi:UDP-N-acetylglucosamine 3-dehydrogenase